MKRPSRKDYAGTENYFNAIFKYIDFLESNQKEFEEWLEKMTRETNGVNDDHIQAFIFTLTKYKELNKNNE